MQQCACCSRAWGPGAFCSPASTGTREHTAPPACPYPWGPASAVPVAPWTEAPQLSRSRGRWPPPWPPPWRTAPRCRCAGRTPCRWHPATQSHALGGRTADLPKHSTAPRALNLTQLHVQPSATGATMALPRPPALPGIAAPNVDCKSSVSHGLLSSSRHWSDGQSVTGPMV